jgi:uncharacterized protein DUF6345
MRMRTCVALAATAATAAVAPADAATTRLPIYLVKSAGTTRAQATRLAGALALPNRLRENDGSLFYIDDARYQRVPTKRLPSTGADEDGRPTFAEAFDFAALKRLTVMGKTAARNKAASAFRVAGLQLLSGARVTHSQFQAFDNAGASLANRQLDTQVAYPPRLNGRPMVGPGARAKIAFDMDGRVTLLAYANRTLERGPMVTLRSTSSADGIARGMYGGACPGERGLGNIRLNRQVVYYAPSLRRGRVNRIVPHYAYSGTADSEGQQVKLNRIVIPAVATGAPSASLTASAAGAVVKADTTVRGGRGPLSYRYSSCATSLNPLRSSRGKNISYLVRARPGRTPTPNADTLTAVVTDADGLVSVARKTVPLKAVPPFVDPTATLSVGGKKDFGTEWIGSTQGVDNGATNAADFADEMEDEGIWRFNWNDGNVFWTDFVDQVFGGDDINWVDNADLVWYEGHGNPDLFVTGQKSTFSSSGYITVGWSNTRWGNSPGDLEWLSLLGCNILQSKNSNGVGLGGRWLKSLKGAHMLLGYATESWDFDSVGNEFGDAIADDHKRIRNAWAHSAQEQYSGTVYAYMGPLGTGSATNYNDYVWGLGGGTTSDIPSPVGYWAAFSTV